MINIETATDDQLRDYCARVDPNGIWYAGDDPDCEDATRAECLAVIRAWMQEDGE